MTTMVDAIVHEWIGSRAGSELVFEAIARCMPTAELIALSASPGVELDLGGRQLTTTSLDRAFLRNRRSLTLPLMPLAWRLAARNKKFETVVVSHHAAAIQYARHCEAERCLAYVHTPGRYVWTPELDGRGSSRLLQPARGVLQRNDLKALAAIDSIAANSVEVARRIQRHWNREAHVIHPPVNTRFFSAIAETKPGPEQGYILGVSRFIPYKRLDLVIDTGEQLGMPVVIAGAGPGEGELRAHAERRRIPVSFRIHPTDSELRDLYRNAACLVFPVHEDFGIVPVEAQAAGTPVVGIRAGGVLETVDHGSTGVLVADLTASALAQGVRDSAGISAEACRRWAAQFSSERFEAEVIDWITA
jgi:glycosyltransferase involved in cell wall biosynthesis